MARPERGRPPFADNRGIGADGPGKRSQDNVVTTATPRDRHPKPYSKPVVRKFGSLSEALEAEIADALDAQGHEIKIGGSE